MEKIEVKQFWNRKDRDEVVKEATVRYQLVILASDSEDLDFMSCPAMNTNISVNTQLKVNQAQACISMSALDGMVIYCKRCS